VGTYVFDDGTELRVGDGHIGPHTRRVYEVLTGIQRGKRAAPEGWLFLAPRNESRRTPRAPRAPVASRPKKPSPKSKRPPARRRASSRPRR
jgi:hypothetical protein